MKQFLKYVYKPNLLILFLAGIFLVSCGSYNTIKSDRTNEPLSSVDRVNELDQDDLEEASFPDLSTNFVHRVINDQTVDKHLEIFKNADPDELEQSLDSPQKRLTFWTNIYNGYTQYFLKKDPTLYKENRSAYFSKDQIEIAGFTVSFEDVEHGVLRKGATIWSKGNVRIRLFRKKFIRKYHVKTVDYRIHFALNCGATSCPPVVAYQTELVDQQMDDNSEYYLNKEAEYRPDEDAVYVPAIMNWFSGDFGGNDGKREILKKFGVIPQDSNPSIKKKEYDWTIKIENYKYYDY